jgi:hypothetical protein
MSIARVVVVAAVLKSTDSHFIVVSVINIVRYCRANLLDNCRRSFSSINNSDSSSIRCDLIIPFSFTIHCCISCYCCCCFCCCVQEIRCIEKYYRIGGFIFLLLFLAIDIQTIILRTILLTLLIVTSYHCPAAIHT